MKYNEYSKLGIRFDFEVAFDGRTPFCEGFHLYCTV